MNIKVKFGDSNRITIPLQVREELGLVKGDYFNLTLDENKIILEKEEESSESDLGEEDIKEEIISKPNNEMSNNDNNKSRLQDLLEKVQEQPEIYWDRGILKHRSSELIEEPEESDTEELDDKPSNTLCECGEPIGDSRLIVNDKYICRRCRNNLRDRLYMDIKYQQRLKELNNY